MIGVQEVENLATLQALATTLNRDAREAREFKPRYEAYLEKGKADMFRNPVRQRVPQTSTPMRAIDERVGWLGDNTTGEAWPSAGYTLSTADKTWLPDEQSARAWQLLRVADNPARPLG